jgi:hypothetical protein
VAPVQVPYRGDPFLEIFENLSFFSRFQIRLAARQPISTDNVPTMRTSKVVVDDVRHHLEAHLSGSNTESGSNSSGRRQPLVFDFSDAETFKIPLASKSNTTSI